MFIDMVSDNSSSSIGAKCGRCRSDGAWNSHSTRSYKHSAPNGANFSTKFLVKGTRTKDPRPFQIM